VNKFKLICVLGIKLKFCDPKSFFDDLIFYNIMCYVLQVFHVFVQVFIFTWCLCLHSFFMLLGSNFYVLKVSSFWFRYGVSLKNLFVMCCMCEDSDNYRCQCGSTQQQRNGFFAINKVSFLLLQIRPHLMISTTQICL
jgi:hypothetical protein